MMEDVGLSARRVMVVADPTRESGAALEYALSHAIVDKDTLILFHVENPNAWKNPFGSFFKRNNNNNNNNSPASAGEEVDFLEGMRKLCMAAQPRVNVSAVKAEMGEGKDKAAVILAHTVAHKVDLLIVGHRRSLSNAILGSKRGGSRGLDTADNLILNSKCTCVAVQRKGQNAGYLLSSKTYKNFWLLA